LRTFRLAAGANPGEARLIGVAMRGRPINGEERPSRAQVDPAALELLARHGPQVMATARRWAANPEDAEDAYQRGIEILLTKAPTTNPDELVPWLKTVVKHEAFAARRQRERHSPVTDDGDVADPGTDAAATHEQAASYERLRQGAEAMSVLKPQEVRALLLKAEGYSYREICEITGWTYTKVNRCLTEGRRAFAEQVQGIQAGAECDRLAPVLSALVDGEAGAQDLAALRPHLKTCLSCRVRLREFRAAPSRVAAFVPPVALVASTSPAGGGGLRGLFESLVEAAQHKTAALAERAHAAAELAAGPKAAAIAASAAAVAGGGAAAQQITVPDGHTRTPAAEREVQVRPAAEEVPAAVAEPAPVSTPPAAPAPQPAATPDPAPPVPEPAQEFDPTASAQPAAVPAAARPADAAFAPGGSSEGGRGSGGEFAP
jgi:RNA polymerase sigma factor (sigma-70 family)